MQISKDNSQYGVEAFQIFRSPVTGYDRKLAQATASARHPAEERNGSQAKTRSAENRDTLDQPYLRSSLLHQKIESRSQNLPLYKFIQPTFQLSLEQRNDILVRRGREAL
ncbi:hypothetical protein DYI23_12710 [Roseibium polysiphoniae]|uniref:Uncharacterized protein n=1 Tax=Roseibium polysiphoniae TaxID=2571221 RepID=A0A944GU01_9HYPH|nr:hypothetical protein [Roseibium polysiphoniae]